MPDLEPGDEGDDSDFFYDYDNGDSNSEWSDGSDGDDDGDDDGSGDKKKGKKKKPHPDDDDGDDDDDPGDDGSATEYPGDSDDEKKGRNKTVDTIKLEKVPTADKAKDWIQMVVRRVITASRRGDSVFKWMKTIENHKTTFWSLFRTNNMMPGYQSTFCRSQCSIRTAETRDSSERSCYGV